MRNRRLLMFKTVSAFLFVTRVAGTATATTTEWPSLRGPSHDGGSTGRLSAAPGAAFEVAWRANVGSGYSSAAVAEDRAVTFFSNPTNDGLVAFDARTGRELWRRPLAPAWTGHDGSFDGPLSTPALGHGRVFALTPRGGLVALDAATGRPLWEVDLVKRERAVRPTWGFSASPVLAAGTLVVPIGAPGGAIAGFDPATGALRWKLGDDRVTYQSPVVVNALGRELVVAAGHRRLFGIDPVAGRLVFEHGHGGDDEEIGAGSLVPVPAGEDRLFLKTSADASTMVRIAIGPAGVPRVDTLWTAPVLRATYSVPVYHGGFLYGMNGRATLTCVDAATGETRWRSREPGDGFTMIVGDDLVVLTKERTLHVASASPHGWKERARLEIFGDLTWSPPAFAEGALFARSQGEVVRVDWRAPHAEAAAAPSRSARTPPAAGSRPASPRLAALLDEVEHASDKAAAVSAFLAAQPRLPIVEEPDRVIFLYRGPEPDVGIAGDMLGDRREDPMHRLPGTDLFWYETTLEPDARVSYYFVVRGEERVSDPGNPWRVPGPRSPPRAYPKVLSSVAMPAWRDPDHLHDPPSERRGRIDVHDLACGSRPGTKVTVHVYVPAGYDKETSRLPVVLVRDGDVAREDGLVPQSLDNLIPGRVAPLVVAFVGSIQWGNPAPGPAELADADARAMARDVVPFLDARYRTDPRREARAVVGAGGAGLLAALTVFRQPQAFGALGAQSAFLLTSYERVARSLVPSAAEWPLRLYLDWGRYDLRATREVWNVGEANARLGAFLREKGHAVAGGEAPEGWGYASWRNRTDLLFEALFPAQAPRAASSDDEGVLHRFVEALNRHDVEAQYSHYAPDFIHLDEGQRTAPHVQDERRRREFERASGARWSYEVKGRGPGLLEAVLTEDNAFYRALGVGSRSSRRELRLRDGKIHEMSVTGWTQTGRPYPGARDLFKAWLLREQPSLAAGLVGPEGLVFDGDTAKVLTGLARDWRAAQPCRLYHPSFDPKGKRLAFSSDCDGKWNVYVMEGDGSDPRRLTDNSADSRSPVWSPDGERIAFHSSRDGDWELYSVAADGTDLRRLTRDPGRDRIAAYSPDGKEILFTSDRDGSDEVFVMGARGGRARRLTTRTTVGFRPLWAPDGSLILHPASRRKGAKEGEPVDLFRVRPDGVPLEPLPGGPRRDFNHTYSPDGRTIAFDAHAEGAWESDDGQWELWLMNADGGGRRRLTRNAVNDWGPSFSPDGKRLVFLAGLENVYDVYTMNVDGTGRRRLTRWTANPD